MLVQNMKSATEEMSKTNWHAKLSHVLLVLTLVLALGIVTVPMAGTVEAQTVRHVATNCTGIPAPCYTSIQAAINASSALGGDTVMLHPGNTMRTSP